MKEKAYHYKFIDIGYLKVLKNVIEPDVSIENGRMEFCIPYQLLNLYNPLKITIHDDYYKTFWRRTITNQSI